MDDVKTEVPEAPVEPAENPAEPESLPAEKTPETPEVPEAPAAPAERTVPISVLQEERRKRQEFQRKLAEAEEKTRLAGVDPNDTEAVMSHPIVQDLLMKQAKQELTDFARTELDKYPKMSQVIKKAILANVRGFVNENTRDTGTAKLDLQEYIESIAEDSEAQTPETPVAPKAFQVAKTNVSKSEIQGTRPGEVEKILNKPVTDWTDKETEIVEDYAKNSK